MEKALKPKKSNTFKSVGFLDQPIDDFSIVLCAHKGIEVDWAFELADQLMIPYDEFSSLLQFSTKTLKNYQKEEKRLNPISSEQVLKLNKMRILGLKVFGTPQFFNNWLKKPAMGLDNEIPYALLQTSGGIDLIIEELESIAHGDFS